MAASRQIRFAGIRVYPFALVLGLAIACLNCAIAEAQQVSPSRLVPSLRPTGGRETTVSLPGPTPRNEPANAKRTFVFVRRITVINGFARLRQRTAALVANVEGHRVTVDDIYKLAAALQQAYADDGFALVQVIIPPQRLQSGNIDFVVIDGFIKSIDVSQLPSVDRNRAAEIMAPLIGLRHVTLSEIQRRLLLVGEIPGLNARNITSNPDESGAVVLTLQGTQRLVTGTVGADNRLPSDLDIYELTSLFSLNNALGLGEQAYIGTSSSSNLQQVFDDNAPWASVGGGFILPLGDDGFNINPSYIWARTLPNPEGGPLIDNVFDRFSVRANYPLLLTLKQILRVQGGFDYIQEHETPLGYGFDINRDQYSAFRFAAVYGYLFSSGTKILLTGTISQGLGGRSGTDVIPLSRPGASPEFTKFDLDLRLTQPLPDNLRLLVLGHAQTSFGSPLMVAEQLSLDGPEGLSGYSAGTIPVDQGGTLRSELSREFDFAGGKDGSISFYPYLFGAGGRGYLQEPLVNEIPVINAASVGFGVRNDLGFGSAPVGSSVNVEFAKDFSNIPYRQDGYRGNVSVAVRF